MATTTATIDLDQLMMDLTIGPAMATRGRKLFIEGVCIGEFEKPEGVARAIQAGVGVWAHGIVHQSAVKGRCATEVRQESFEGWLIGGLIRL